MGITMVETAALPARTAATAILVAGVATETPRRPAAQRLREGRRLPSKVVYRDSECAIVRALVIFSPCLLGPRAFLAPLNGQPAIPKSLPTRCKAVAFQDYFFSLYEILL